MEDEIKLYFPLTGGGCEFGPNEAGLETFTGNYYLYLARECVQNSIDAVENEDRPVKVTFSEHEIDSGTVPAIDVLKAETIPSCRAFQSGDKKAQCYCNTAENILAKDTIPFLKISDSNTKGLRGTDKDREGAWYALVKASGVSNKPGEGSGGSFGIGKYAPLAASGVRTVFYSSRTIDGDAAFQGVTEWWSHKNNDGKITQGRGYIGNLDENEEDAGRFCAVRGDDAIPNEFLRHEPGTDIWIMGFNGDSEWQDRIAFYLLENFWLSIREGIVEFEIDGELLASENLETRLQEFNNKENSFDAWHQYRAVNEGEKKQMECEHLGVVDLYLFVKDEENLPRNVVGIRKTGMLIEERMEGKRSPCRRQYSGVLHCSNKDGNEILRSMEPPRHDRWDTERIKDNREHVAAYKSMINWVKGELRELNPKPTTDPVDIADLSRFLPDLPSEEDASPDENEREFEGKPVTGELEIREASHEQKRDGYAMSGGENGDGDGSRGRSSRTKGGKSTGSGGSQIGKSKRVGLRAIEQDGGRYVLVVRSEESVSGDLLLSAIGDDGAGFSAVLNSAKQDGKQLAIDDNRIRDIEVKAGEAVRISAEFQQKIPMALSASVVLSGEVK